MSSTGFIEVHGCMKEAVCQEGDVIPDKFFTALVWSAREGNVFTGVCHSVHNGGEGESLFHDAPGTYPMMQLIEPHPQEGLVRKESPPTPGMTITEGLAKKEGLFPSTLIVPSPEGLPLRAHPRTDGTGELGGVHPTGRLVWREMIQKLGWIWGLQCLIKDNEAVGGLRPVIVHPLLWIKVHLHCENVNMKATLFPDRKYKGLLTSGNIKH